MISGTMALSGITGGHNAKAGIEGRR